MVSKLSENERAASLQADLADILLVGMIPVSACEHGSVTSSGYERVYFAN